MALESDHEAAAGWGRPGETAEGSPRLPAAPAGTRYPRRPSCLRWAASGAGSEDRGEEAAWTLPCWPLVPRRRASPWGQPWRPWAVRALHACEPGRSGSGCVAHQRPRPRKGKDVAHAPSSRKPIQVSLSF